MGPVRIFHLSGEYDAVDVARIERACHRVRRSANGTTTIVDMTTVIYFDATLVAAIASLSESLRRDQPASGIVIVSPSEMFARRLLDLSGLTAKIARFDDVAAARRYVDDRARMRQASSHRWHGAFSLATQRDG